MPDRKIPAHVLALAARQFRSKGYAGTTTRELAALLGVQSASMYHYFKKKEDLLYIVATEAIETLTDTVGAAIAAEPPTEAKLRRLVSTHMEVVLADPDSHTVMLIELRVLSPARRRRVVARRNAYEENVRGVIAEIQASGGIRTDIDAGMLTLLLFNLMNWTVFWYNPDGTLGPSELSEVVLEVFLGGCRAPTRGLGSEADASPTEALVQLADATGGAAAESQKAGKPGHATAGGSHIRQPPGVPNAARHVT